MPFDDKTIPIPFPWKGIDRGEASCEQPKFTTFDLLNVRALHYGDAQGGGKRDGITKAFSTQLGVQPTDETSDEDESLWRRVNELNFFIATSSGVVVPCQQSELSFGFGGAGTRMLESPEGKLNVVGDFVVIDAVTVSAGNRRFAIWDTDDEGWTAPGGFDTSMANPAALTLFGGNIFCGGGANTAGKNQLYERVAGVWTNRSINATTTGFTGGNAEIYCLCVFNGDLYVAGSFTAANGTTCANIAKYGNSAGVFTAVGSGGSNGVQRAGSAINGRIYAMEVHDGKLYVAGLFTTANGTGVSAVNVAAWDGSAWTALSDGTNVGVGLTDTVAQAAFALRSWNGKLYIGGLFNRLSTTTGAGHNLIASWDGSNYGKLIWGLNDRGGNSNSTVGVKAMEIYDDGTGEKLWVFGQFNAVSTTDNQGMAAPNYASWDGAEWAVAKLGTNNIIRHGLGAGVTIPKSLYLCGTFTRRNVRAIGGIAAFDGAEWKAIGGAGATGISAGSGSIIPANTVSGNAALAAGALVNDATVRLYVSIVMSGTGSNETCRYGFGPAAIQEAGVAVLTGNAGESVWTRLSDGTVHFNNHVYAMKIWNGRLYVGGAFTAAAPISARMVVWNGTSFETIPSTPSSNEVLAFEVFDDGTGAGEKLYVACLAAMGGLSANNGTFIAAWSGAAWTGLVDAANSGGASGAITCLKAWNGKLYMGGEFTTCKGTAAKRVASWDGTTIAVVGGGTGGGFSAGVVSALEVYKNELYAAGTFTATADSTTVNGVARFDLASSTWKAMGSGLAASAGTARGVSMLVYGGFLYIGGVFDTVNGQTARCIVKWDGSAFTAADPTEVAGFHSTDGVANADIQAMVEFAGSLIAVGQADFVGGDPSAFVTVSDCQ